MQPYKSVEVKMMDFNVRHNLTLNTQSLIICMTLGKLLNTSNHNCLILKMGFRSI